MRRVAFAICGTFLLGAASGSGQVPTTSAGTPAANQTATSSPAVDSFAEQIAKQIEKKHLKSVLVIGATGPKSYELTQDGQDLGDEISASLTKQANGFQVVDRVTLRDFVKKNGLSEVMVVSDNLADWIARKAGVAGFVVIQFGPVSNGKVRIGAELYKTNADDGDSLITVKTELELSADEKRVGFRPLDSDWNKPTIPEAESKKLPPDRSPHCASCAPPAFSQLARGQGRNIDETVSLYVTVLSDGAIGDLAIVKPAPFGMNTIAVETILQKWHFKPALDSSGKAIPFRVNIELRYQAN